MNINATRRVEFGKAIARIVRLLERPCHKMLNAKDVGCPLRPVLMGLYRPSLHTLMATHQVKSLVPASTFITGLALTLRNMMDLSKAKQIVNDHLEHLRWAMQLQQWTLTVEYVHLEENVYAEVHCNTPYMSARISIDNDKFGNHEQDELIDTLTHEMLHLMHADFETYRTQVRVCVGAVKWEMLEEQYTVAAERLIGNIQRMLDSGLGLTPLKMIEQSRVVSRRKQEGSGSDIPQPG